MHWAVRAGAMECTGILLRHGVSVDALNAAQRTFLQLAADRDQIETVQLLAWSGAELNTQDKEDRPSFTERHSVVWYTQRRPFYNW